MTTARFAQVLAKSGTPHVHLTWTTPTRDKTLRAALAHHRLLTVQQNARGQKKDFGLVGLHPGKNVQYLIFPKSLRAFAGKRIVGIDYSAIAEDTLAPADPRSSEAKTKPRSRPATPKKTARTHAADVIAFKPTPPPQPAPPPQSAPASPSPSKDQPAWLAEVRRAAADLKRGRTVAAYDRLQRLLAKQV